MYRSVRRKKCGSPSALGLAPSWQTERIAAAAHEDPAHQSNSSLPQMGPIFEITAGKCTTSPTQLAIGLPKTGRCPVFVAKNAKIYADHDQSTLKMQTTCSGNPSFFNPSKVAPSLQWRRRRWRRGRRRGRRDTGLPAIGAAAVALVGFFPLALPSGVVLR